MRAALVSALLLLGCQDLLGFESFVRDTVEDGGATRRPDASPPSRGGGGGASGGAGGGAVATLGEGAGAGVDPTSSMDGSAPAGGAPVDGAAARGGDAPADGSAGFAGGGPNAKSTTHGAGGNSNGHGGTNPGSGGRASGGTTGDGGDGNEASGGVAGACSPHCAGLETSLDAVSCDMFGVARCENATPQCNPRNGTCFALDVDATEVTMADYLAWVATVPGWDDPPAACIWKQLDFSPEGACMSDVPCAFPRAACDGGAHCGPELPSCETSSLPVVCVDWCDAYAYCQAHGRRLCGSLHDGPLPFALAADPGESQWTNACSAGGQYEYASSDESVTGCAYGGAMPYPVGTRGCHSPSPGYSRFLDMSGNVAEWEDACDPVNAGMPGRDDPCAIRGGSYASSRSELECERVETMLRHQPRHDVGFRCCGG